MTASHDVIHVLVEPSECIVICACGAEYTAPNRVRAMQAHANHFGIATARAALDPKEPRASDS